MLKLRFAKYNSQLTAWNGIAVSSALQDKSLSKVSKILGLWNKEQILYKKQCCQTPHNPEQKIC
jgi:hypothetical protein